MNNNIEMNDNNSDCPVKEMMSGCYYYERKKIKKTRVSKWCNLCNKHIPKESSMTALKLCNGEFFERAICDDCMVKYEKDINLLMAGKFDDF